MVKIIFGKPVYLVITGLILLSLISVFFDVRLSDAALSYSAQTNDETNVLGELFQVTRLFGKADVVILLGALLGLAGKRQLLLKILVSLLFVAVLVHPVKHLVGRERPDGSSSHVSFPSGDTATAFVMPEVFSANLPLTVASTGVAALAGVSRVFYGRHYPTDVLMGAAIGIVAGLLGCWLVRRLRWKPSLKLVTVFTLAVLFCEFLNALFKGHHRHVVQFLVWYGPALFFYVSHKRLKLVYGRNHNPLNKFSPDKFPIFLMLERALSFCFVLGILMIVMPWLSGLFGFFSFDSSGLRAPAFSAGLLLSIFAFYARNSVINGKQALMLADMIVLLYIGSLGVLGYLLGVI